MVVDCFLTGDCEGENAGRLGRRVGRAIIGPVVGRAWQLMLSV